MERTRAWAAMPRHASTVGRLAVAFAAAAFLAALAPSSSGQQQPPTFRVEANFVRLDVHATADGVPVGDLTRDDFEVFEDGVRQSIAAFEHVSVRPRAVEVERVEPRSLDESLRMAADARYRLFALFLDTYHVTDETASHSGRARLPGSTKDAMPRELKPLGPSRLDRALIEFLDRTLAPTDLVAAMTPEMEASEVTFTRRGDRFDEYLRTMWARRFSWDNLDPEEEGWAVCYQPDEPYYLGVVEEMVLRRREDLAIRRLRDLAMHLGELRPERKAVLVISEGWRLFRPNQHLARPLSVVPGGNALPPPPPEVYVGTDGKLKVGTDPRVSPNVTWQGCEAARVHLAHLDNLLAFQALPAVANRANVSFYPVDPRGLAALDTPPDATSLGAGSLNRRPSVVEDQAALRARLEVLANLASATDGTVTLTNDLSAGLKKISDDLSEYYLLGYYSSNTTYDGKYRKLSVRVKRPGIDVRARDGYRAATEAEVKARMKAAEAADPDNAARVAALASLGRVRPGRAFHILAGYGWPAAVETSASPGSRQFWVVGELTLGGEASAAWQEGARATITVTAAGDRVVSTREHVIPAASRSFAAWLPGVTTEGGEYLVVVEVRPEGAGAGAADRLRIRVPKPGAGLTGEPMLWRRGPFTGPAFQPTANSTFRRAERMRADVPLSLAAAELSATLLDRNGRPLGVPVTVARRDEEGRTLASAELALAPLAPGDFLLEVTARHGERHDKRLIALRIVP